MGAWGARSFENADAMDFLGDHAEAPAGAPDELRQRFEAVEGDEYLEAPDGAEALAAAAIVSAARDGSPVHRDDPSVTEYLDKIVPHVPTDLAPLAVEAIDRVLGQESELVELWEEAGELGAFRAEPLAVREHLSR